MTLQQMREVLWLCAVLQKTLELPHILGFGKGRQVVSYEHCVVEGGSHIVSKLRGDKEPG